MAWLVAVVIVAQMATAKPGGSADAPVTDKEVVAAAKFAIEARQKILAGQGSKDTLTLVKIVAAQKQVVAGMNYHLTLQVKVGEKKSTVKATVYERPWEKHIELTNWAEAK
jgi:hypothetical protein